MQSATRSRIHARWSLWSRSVPILIVAILLLAGCSESTMIHTNPPGAIVWINGKELGTAPVKLKVKSWDARRDAYHYHVEKPGYQPKDGYVQPHLSIGRVASAAFSSCLTCSHGFFEFDPDTEIALSPEGAPQQPPEPTATEDPAAVRLRRLQALRDEGLITDADYEQQKAEVLRDVVGPHPEENRGPPAIVRDLLEQFRGAADAPR